MNKNKIKYPVIVFLVLIKFSLCFATNIELDNLDEVPNPFLSQRPSGIIPQELNVDLNTNTPATVRTRPVQVQPYLGIMDSLGGNAMCSLICTGGCVLGVGAGLAYLYFHVGFETTNAALKYLASPLAIGIASGSTVGCAIGYCVKKHLDNRRYN